MDLLTTLDGVALLEFLHAELKARKSKLNRKFVAATLPVFEATWARTQLGTDMLGSLDLETVRKACAPLFTFKDKRYVNNWPRIFKRAKLEMLPKQYPHLAGCPVDMSLLKYLAQKVNGELKLINVKALGKMEAKATRYKDALEHVQGRQLEESENVPPQV